MTPNETTEPKKRKPRKTKTETAPPADPAQPETPPPPPPTPAQTKLAVRKAVRYFYDLQRLRMQMANRQGEARTEEDAPREPTEGRPNAIDLHPFDQVTLVTQAMDLEALEKNALRTVGKLLDRVGFYRDVLSDKELYKGIGPTMAGVIIAEIDITRARTPSALWRYAGLAPVNCWRAIDGFYEVVPAADEDPTMPEWFVPKVKAKGQPERLSRTQVKESGKAERPTKGEKLHYNAFLKTKMVGVLADVLIRLGSPWRKHYDEFKHRWVSSNKGRSDGHRDRAAKRYMVKMLLLDIWTRWRTYEGLEVRPSYQDAKIGHHEKA